MIHAVAEPSHRVATIVGKAAERGTESISAIGRAVMLLTSVFLHVVDGVSHWRLAVTELFDQTWHLFKVAALPAVLTAIPFGAVVSVQVGSIVSQVGAGSLAGAASGMGIIRQGAPLASGLLLGGAAAAAIAADLGARSIREELDALRVIGVDPVQRLVTPRMLALLLVAPALLFIIITIGVGSSYVTAVYVSDVSPGGFWQSFGAFAGITDIVYALVKVEVAAVVVGTVASMRGMEATGGPRGVADAVNQAVILSVVVIILLTLAVTQVQTMFSPIQVA
ncbi:ABC transporter permease [Gordonia sp. MP11Mi]|uniref:Intermembrane phospholipid transport system permease protein MlaE n=1 Tax=Gordonia sp. MP11Mi TaxID=3022769 RepID=A0AA97CXS4_9ACTN